MNNRVDIQSLICEINKFVHERGWEKHHTPRNIATSVAIESAELLEHFQWDDLSYDDIKNDEQKLRNFFELMEPIVSSQLTQKGNKEEKFVTISFDRYNNALEEKMPESRLTYRTMCLGALYLEGEMELTRRLSQRVACVMSFFGYEPLDVFNTMKKSYEIRSRFVHGSKIEKKHRKNLAELEKELMNYARVSIIMFLQLQGSLEKDDFLSKLDTSLLGEKAKKELNDFLKEKCQIIQ